MKSKNFKVYSYTPVPEGQECKVQKHDIKDKETKSRQIETFTYLSKKQMRRYIRQQEQENNLDVCHPDIQGYFKLKKSNEDINSETHTADAVVQMPKTQFDVRYKAKPFHKVKGYIFTAEKEVFLAIEKIMIFPIVLLLLFLGAGIWQALPNTPSIPEAIEAWIPDIQDNLGKQNEKEKSEIGSIEVKGFSKWHVPAGQNENLTIALENPASNRCYFTFTMTLDDTNEVLYQSKMVPPGEGIYRITLSKPLEAGEYNATVFIKTNELETGAEMNSCEIKTVIISD